MAAMKTLFVVLMCLVAALAAFSSPVEAKGKVRLRLNNLILLCSSYVLHLWDARTRVSLCPHTASDSAGTLTAARTTHLQDRHYTH